MEEYGSKRVVRTGRNLDIDGSRELKKALADALEMGVSDIELDFSGTESVDSSGLGKLLLFNEKFKELKGDFRIVNVTSKEVAQLFRLINLERFFSIQYKDAGVS